MKMFQKVLKEKIEIRPLKSIVLSSIINLEITEGN